MIFDLFRRPKNMPGRGKMIEQRDTSYFTPEVVSAFYNEMWKNVAQGQIQDILLLWQKRDYEKRWVELGEELNQTIEHYRNAGNGDAVANLHDRLAVIYLQIADFGADLSELTANREGLEN